MLASIDTWLITATAVVSIVVLGIYVFGDKPFDNKVSRVLFMQNGVVATVITYFAVRRNTSAPTLQIDHINLIVCIIFSVLLAVEIAVAVVFAHTVWCDDGGKHHHRKVPTDPS